MKRSARLLPVLSSLLCLLLLFTGCSASSKGNSNEMLYSNDTADQYTPAEKPMAVEPTVEESDAGTGLGTQSGGMDDRDLRKIIYNASMDITADDPAAAMRAIVEKAAALGGYVANSSTSNDDDGTSHVYLTIKIPFDKLDAL